MIFNERFVEERFGGNVFGDNLKLVKPFFQALDRNHNQIAEEILAEISLEVFKKFDEGSMGRDEASNMFMYTDLLWCESYKTAILSDDAEEILNEGQWFGFADRTEGKVKEPELSYFKSLAAKIRERRN